MTSLKRIKLCEFPIQRLQSWHRSEFLDRTDVDTGSIDIFGRHVSCFAQGIRAPYYYFSFFCLYFAMKTELLKGPTSNAMLKDVT